MLDASAGVVVLALTVTAAWAIPASSAKLASLVAATTLTGLLLARLLSISLYRRKVLSESKREVPEHEMATLDEVASGSRRRG